MDELDQEYQRRLKACGPDDPQPPCPRCEGKMEIWDCWLVTGVECTVCEWSMSEGSGSIA